MGSKMFKRDSTVHTVLGQIFNIVVLVALLISFLPAVLYSQSDSKSISTSTSAKLTPEMHSAHGNTATQQLAFPGAEGFGQYTTGGRGGEIYHVTNLNDSGPGSLRNGIEMEGPRIIIFRLSGTIHLQSELKIRHDDISIFGQTAPGDGIAIKGAGTVIDADNVIIQHIRFRPGDISPGEPDALWGRQQKDIIIDHVSMSWSVDETGSFYDNENFTLQWSILSESLYESKHEKGRHGYGGIWGGAGATFHHNLLAHHSSRNPRFNGARYTTTPETELVDFRNNVIYNWGNNSAYAGEEGNHNVVANYYKAGPATGNNRDRILDASTHSSGFDFGKWYITDNYVHGFPGVTQDNWDGGVQRVSDSVIERIRMDEPFNAPVLPSEETAEEAFLSVLGKAGAILPKRDTLDERIVQEVETGSAAFGGTYGYGLGIIDSQEDVGGWPELLSATPLTDTDQDGIPDEWESGNGLDPNDASDAAVINDSGYSNFESYIHTITKTYDFVPLPGQVNLVFPVGETSVSVEPQFEWSAASEASDYEIEVALGVGQDPVITDIVENTVVHTFADPFEGNRDYYWRVKGLNEEGEGQWSDYEHFKTEMPTSSDKQDQQPNQYRLNQNYPNPFNPTTFINYELPEAGDVKLYIYNFLGQRVTTLVDEQQAAGIYDIQFDASNLASGSYIYRLEAGDYFQMRQMILIK